jgi:hypothetical protein
LLDPPQNSADFGNFNDTKIVDVIPIENGNFMILGASDELSVFVKLLNNNNNFSLPQSETQIQIEGSQKFLGINLAQIGPSDFAVTGNIDDVSSSIFDASILKSNSNSGTTDWQRVFGTEYNYTSGKVLVLENGSVVFTGSAGLNGQSKVFFIKLKSNGEMK